MGKTILLVALLLSPLFCNVTFACSCPTIGGTTEQIKTARLEDYKKAVAIFSGEVVELEENKVKFKVEKIWKGELVDEIIMVIHFKEGGGNYVRTSCDYHYEIGQKYLVYAYKNMGELTTYQCTRTTSFKNQEFAEQEIKGLNEIRLPNIRKSKTNEKN